MMRSRTWLAFAATTASLAGVSAQQPPSPGGFGGPGPQQPAFRYERPIVTGGSGAAETDDVFRTVGLMDVVQEVGATFVDHNRPPFKDVELQYEPPKDVQGPQKTVKVNPRVLMRHSSPSPN